MMNKSKILKAYFYYLQITKMFNVLHFSYVTGV